MAARRDPSLRPLRYAQGTQGDSVEAERDSGELRMGGVNPVPTTARQTQREKPQTSRRNPD